ncbi:hypothetical protein LINGRAHAP2_LOCUS31987 [Linum grandiflorum]
MFVIVGCRLTFSAAKDEEVNVWYCNSFRFTRYYHPELQLYKKEALQSLCLNIPDPSNTTVKYRLPYPTENPLLYASSFCEKSSASVCQHCLQLGRKTLLHQCHKHAIGGEFYTETCAMRFELYNFFT